MEEVFHGDPEFSAGELIPFDCNAPGMIDVWTGAARRMSLDLVFGTATLRDKSSAATGREISELQIIYGAIAGGACKMDWKDEDGAPLFDHALKRLGALGEGEIYGFAPACAAGGRYPAANLQTATAGRASGAARPASAADAP